MSTALYSLGRLAYRYHRRVLAGWLLLIVVLGVAAAGLGAGTRDSFEIPGTESQDAVNALDRTFPELSGASAYLVVVPPSGRSVDSPRTQGLVERAVDRMEDVEGVVEVVSPYSDSTGTGISDDRSAAQVQVQFDRPLTEVTGAQIDDLAATADALRDAGYTARFGGDVFTSTGPQLSVIEALGVLVALVVLYLMFRSWRAAVLPLVTGGVGVVVAMAATFALTGFVTVSSTTPLLALMIGLAVGIDYALFILSRHREQLVTGVDPEESTARAVATAGSAVVFAGATVMIALVGLAIARIPFLTVMGAVAALAVLVAVAVALTLLPALFGFAGARLTPRAGDRPGAFARRWVLATTRFPLVAIAIIVVGLAVVTIPSQDLRLALPDNSSAPEGSTQRTAYDLVDEHFGPGYNGPLLVTANIISSNDPVGVVDDITDDLRGLPGVAAIGLSTPNPTADTGVVQVIPTTGPRAEETQDLVTAIRAKEPAWKAEHGVDVSVTGLTAGGIDISQRLSGALLPFGLVVVGLSLLLLTIVFRTALVPVKATIGFLLSTGASFGAVVAVFQWGWLGSLVNLGHTGPVISFLPIVLMAVLFGLSMDYEVFLMSRMKEEYTQSGHARRAIVDGFVGSSRVVTAAAVIMLAVFVAFVPDGDPNIKPIAFALAVGVFVDAFLVRMLFAPAVLQLFGDLAWALPHRIDRSLPHLDVEGAALHERIALSRWPSPDSSALITAASVTTTGPEGPVLNDVTIQVEPDEWLVVHGPSGSGKTALLLTLAGRMAFDTGRLRVTGHLLPQESVAVRRAVSLAEMPGINDLDDNLTVDQHLAERLSIASFGLWVGRHRLIPWRDDLNHALEHAHTEGGVPFHEVDGGTLVSSLSRLERTMLGVVLALVDEPRMVVVDDVDALRSAEDIALLWSALDHLLEHRSTALVASVQSASSAPERPAGLRLLALDPSRTPREVML